MARKSKTPPAYDALSQAINEALTEGAMQPLIVPSARLPGTQAVKIVRPTQIESVKDTIIRIQQDGDPIGFLMNVMKGAMVECVYIDSEQSDIDPDTMIPVVRSYYEQATLKDRIKIASALARMILPTMSVQEVVVKNSQPEKDATLDDAGAPGQPGFAQLVGRAASRAQQIASEQPLRYKIVEPEPVQLEDGEQIWEGSAGEGLDEQG